jgi:hypothetical protein
MRTFLSLPVDQHDESGCSDLKKTGNLGWLLRCNNFRGKGVRRRSEKPTLSLVSVSADPSGLFPKILRFGVRGVLWCICKPFPLGTGIESSKSIYITRTCVYTSCTPSISMPTASCSVQHKTLRCLLDCCITCFATHQEISWVLQFSISKTCKLTRLLICMPLTIVAYFLTIRRYFANLFFINRLRVLVRLHILRFDTGRLVREAGNLDFPLVPLETRCALGANNRRRVF